MDNFFDPKPPEEVLVEDLSNLGAKKVPLEGDTLTNRAFKYDVALGDQSPGVPTLSGTLSSGEEDSLKQQVAAGVDSKKAEAAKQVAYDAIIGGATSDPILIKNLATVEPTDPETALEQTYVNKMTDTAFALSDNKELRNELLNNQMQYGPVLDAYSKAAVRENVAQSITEDYEAKAKAEGWGSYLLGEAMQIATFPSWYNLTRNSTSYLPGSGMQEKAREIWAMEPNDMSRALKAELETLWAFNPRDAMQFLDYFNNQSDSEALFQNVSTVAGVLPYGKISKGVKAIRGLGKVEKAAHDVSLALSVRKADPEAVLNTAGLVDEAVTLGARQELANRIAPKASGAVKTQLTESFKRLPDFFNPRLRITGAEGLSDKAAKEIADMAEMNVRMMSLATKNVGKVSTLTPEAYEAAFKKAEADFSVGPKHLSDYVRDSIVHVTRHDPDNNFGVGILEVALGTDKGLYSSAEDAVQAAEKKFQLADYEVAQQGGGFVIKVYKPVTEIGADSIDDAILTKANKSNNRHVFFKTLGGDGIKVSEFQREQRGVVATGATQFENTIREIAKPIAELKSDKGAWKRFNKILEVNRDSYRFPGDKKTRGTFYKDTGELAEAYFNHFRRYPTAAEVKAYWTYTQLSDFDWLLRSLNLWKYKSKLGYESFSFEAYTGEGVLSQLAVEGKKQMKLPVHSTEFIEVDATGANRIRTFASLKKEGRDALEQELADGKATLIKRFNPEGTELETIGGTDQVYVLSRNARTGPLRVDKQVNYVPGGHVTYKDEYYVKSANVIGDEFKGDSAIFSANTKAKADELAKNLHTALEKLKSKAADFEDYVRKSLPITPDELKAMLGKQIKKDGQIVALRTGQRSTDTGVRLANGKFFAEHFQGVSKGSMDDYEDLYRSAHDFTQSKDAPIISARKGTEGNPMFTVEQPEMLNPIQSQISALSSAIRSTLYEDYQLQAARSWIEEFGNSASDVAPGLSYQGRKLTVEQLRQNPLFYLKNATLDAKNNPVRVQQAEQIRNAIINLVGKPSKTAQAIDYYKHQLADTLYTKWGEKAAKVVTDMDLYFLKDPYSYARAVAFHTKLGLFNPVQIFVQGTTLMNSVLISPRAALRAGPSSPLMLMTKMTSDPKIIEHFGAMSESMGGLTKKQFIESRRLLDELGIDQIGKEYAWVDDASPPKLFTNSLGHKFLNKGAMFFTQTERAVRIQSWNTAYVEFITKNPGKVGNVSMTDAKKIYNRAQAMFGNMTRDNNAFWQRGLLGNFTQFFSYNARMMELMLGQTGQLSRAERARLFGGYAVLFGLTPASGIALAIQNDDPNAAVTAINPFDEDLRQYALEKGYDLDQNDIPGMMYHGSMATAYAFMTGDHLNFGDRYGVNAINIGDTISRNFDENNVYKAILLTAAGASGNIVNDIITSIFPVVTDLRQMAGQSGETTVLTNDILNATRSLSSANVATRISRALHGQVYRSKNGTTVSGDEDPIQEVVKAISGLKDVKEDDAYRMIKSLQSRKEAVKELTKRAKVLQGFWADKVNAGDLEAAKAIQSQIEALVATYPEVDPQERYDILYPNRETDETLHDSITKSFDKKFPKGASE